MSDLTKNKTANALVWAAFFTFWLHSLHCCRARAASERCVFELTRPRSNSDSQNAFHCSNRFPACRRFVLRAASRFERPEPLKTPSFVRDRGAKKSTCAGVFPPSQIAPEKKFFGDFGAFPNRTRSDVFANDVRLVPASAFLTRFTATFSPALYLRLRKLLN